MSFDASKDWILASEVPVPNLNGDLLPPALEVVAEVVFFLGVDDLPVFLFDLAPSNLNGDLTFPFRLTGDTAREARGEAP
jgi:hypothetical protein